MADQATPKVDYLSRDYSGLRASLLDYAAQRFPDWQPATEGDFGLLMLELFAYMGDIQSYYTDRAQMENYISTATQRESVLGLAYGLGYKPTTSSPASGTVDLITAAGSPLVVVPAGTQLQTGRIDAIDGAITFETAADVTVVANGVAASTVNVTEGESVAYTKIGESTGQPNQFLSLPHIGVYANTLRIFIEDTTGSTTFLYGDTTLNVREWVSVDHLLDADNVDHVFEVLYGSDDVVNLLFGDDINGAIPATGLQIFASYRHGYGASGNVGLGQVYLLNSRSLRGVSVATAADGTYVSGPMTGGADVETTDSIRYNAPRAYRTQNRAVNERDFRDIALGVEGVTKAFAVASTYTSVTVYITGPDGGAPTQTLKDFVAAKFDGKTLVGVSVTVASPQFIPVNFGTVGTPVTIELYDQYSQAAVKANVLTAIRAFIANMSFGKRLTVGKIYDVIEGVEGVQYVDIPVMARNDATQSGTVKITPRVWEVLTAGTINLTATGGVA